MRTGYIKIYYWIICSGGHNELLYRSLTILYGLLIKFLLLLIFLFSIPSHYHVHMHHCFSKPFNGYLCYDAFSMMEGKQMELFFLVSLFNDLSRTKLNNLPEFLMEKLHKKLSWFPHWFYIKLSCIQPID